MPATVLNVPTHAGPADAPTTPSPPNTATAAPTATFSDKLAAVETETRLKQQAVRDTQLRNQHLHNAIGDLHKALEKCAADIQVEDDAIEAAKKRVTATRLYERTTRQQQQRQRQRRPTAGGDDRGDDAALEPVPLPELEDAAEDAAAALAAAREEADACRAALARLLACKAGLESDVTRQLERNSAAHRDAARARHGIEARAKAARAVNTEVVRLERAVAATRERIRALHTEAKAADRYAAKVAVRLSAHDRELAALQAGRLESKRLVCDEVAVAAERDAWIERLKEENEAMTDALLRASVAPPLPAAGAAAGAREGVTTGATVPAAAAVMARAAARGEAALRGGDAGDVASDGGAPTARGRLPLPRPAPKAPETAAAEQRLFGELDAVLRAASSGAARAASR